MVLLAVLATPVGLAVTLERSSYDTWGGFVWGPALLLLCLPLARWVARCAREPEIIRFLMGAAVLKIVIGAILRYVTAQAFYGGLADAAVYDNAGAVLAPQFRRGIFHDLGKISGTRFIEILSGIVQAVIGESRMGNFFVFSFMGFLGLCLLYVAFSEAVPDGNRTLFRRLLFLTPSIWYWPSGIGKEAFILMCLGAMAFGAVRLLDGRVSGAVVGGLGLWGAAIVRPHFALLFLAGVLASLIPLQRRGQAPRGGHTIVRLMVPVLLLLAGLLVLNRLEAFFHLDSIDANAAEQVLSDVNDRTSQGGSEISGGSSTISPVGLLANAATVLARPFPWEQGGVQGVASGLESTVVLGVIGVTITRHRRSIVRSLRLRLPRLVLVYSLAFAAAFGSINNFGILVRQRSLFWPYLFVFICAGAAGGVRAASDRATSDGELIDGRRRGAALGAGRSRSSGSGRALSSSPPGRARPEGGRPTA